MPLTWTDLPSFSALRPVVPLASLAPDLQDIVYQLAENLRLPLTKHSPLALRPFDVATGYHQVAQWTYGTGDERAWDGSQEAMNAAMRAGEPLGPIVVDGAEVLDGRHRLKAAFALGYTVLPAIDIRQLAPTHHLHEAPCPAT